jgi:hypothetical protein
MTNIYISILEYGEKHMTDGISYHDVAEHFKLDLSFTQQNEMAFIAWFYVNFFHHNVEADNILTGGFDLATAMKYNHIKCYMKGDAYFKLLEYRELYEARTNATIAEKNSRMATTLAIASLVLSSIVGLIGIVVGAFQMYCDLNR